MALIPVLTPDDSAAWDRAAEGAGIAPATLMETAGRACAAVIAQRYPELLRQGTLVACGPGNNGGDGWVLARALHRLELPVWVAPVEADGAPLQRAVASRARAEGVRTVAPDGPWPNVALAVDALLGTGARGGPRPPVAALLDRLLDLRVPLVAVDGPTGIDLRTGVIHHHTRAHLTITFGGLRRGHLLAREDVGDVVVVDIGHPPPDPGWPTLVTDGLAAQRLPRFRADVHKGDRGRVVIVGGDTGMTGALRMAGRAAFGAGAGLVHAVAPAETVVALVEAEPDLQTLVQSFDEAPRAALAELLDRADALLVGPGLGRKPGRRELVLELLARARFAVLDADALVALAGAVDRLAELARGRVVVLTPHPGEFRTLFPAHAAAMETDPWLAAAGAAADSGCTVLLKGVPTVIATPAGTSLTVAAGNPGLATGGSGDVLGGIIATLLAQGLEPELAAAVGAQALGRAADIGARRVTARGLR
ncbi:MAG TPA: NAD(P)H-hydrate dehydratase, partial [Gemmatimonadales bacterium]|nr:NAD(P)H-hydrate dehydratase [Gemmatimonadales bacterium]